MYGLYLFIQFPLIGFFLGVCGVFALFKTNSRLCLFLLLFFLMDVVFSAGYMYERQFNLIVPSYLVFSIWIGNGYVFLSKVLDARNLSWLSDRLLIVLLIAAPLLLYFSIPPVLTKLNLQVQKIRSLPYRDNHRYFYLPDKRGYYGAKRFGQEVFNMANANSIVVADFTPMMVLKYLQTVEGVRQDIQLIRVDDPDKGYGALDVAFVEQAMSSGRSVYICDQDDYREKYNTEKLREQYHFVQKGPIYLLQKKH